MSQRQILIADQPFGIARDSNIIAGSRYGTPITGAGPGKPTGHFIDKRIQFAGGFAGAWNVDLEGTVDGTNWVTVQAAITSPGIIELLLFWRMLRLNTNTVGTLTNVGSPHGVVDQPDFTAVLGGVEVDT